MTLRHEAGERYPRNCTDSYASLATRAPCSGLRANIFRNNISITRLVERAISVHVDNERNQHRLHSVILLTLISTETVIVTTVTLSAKLFPSTEAN